MTAYSEKPILNYWASIGIYVINKASPIPNSNERYDMPDLVQSLLSKHVQVVSCESEDLWFDIGTLADLEKAKKFLKS